MPRYYLFFSRDTGYLLDPQLVVIAKSAQVVIAADQLLRHITDIASSSQRRGLGSGSAVSLSENIYTVGYLIFNG
jgi:hypothetical protein